MLPDDDDMAGATQPGRPDEPSLDNAREVFPFVLDKDFTGRTDSKDFRPIPEFPENEVPKASSVQEFATPPISTIGLEDVSKEDLDDPVR